MLFPFVRVANHKLTAKHVTKMSMNELHSAYNGNELHSVKNHLHKCVEICKMYNNGQACFILEGMVSITS